MAKKQIEGNITESGTWYKIPEYKVTLVRDSQIPSEKKKLGTTVDVADMFKTYLQGADREHFCIAMLDRRGNLLGLNTVSVGSLSASVVHPREVFKPAIIIGANSIILCHNHPSGDPGPSKEDVELTKILIKGGKILGIEVLDHVIVGDTFWSMRQESTVIF